MIKRYPYKPVEKCSTRFWESDQGHCSFSWACSQNTGGGETLRSNLEGTWSTVISQYHKVYEVYGYQDMFIMGCQFFSFPKYL